MKTSLVLAVMTAAGLYCLIPLPLHAEADLDQDEMVLSLTRRPSKLENQPTNVSIMTEDEIKNLRAENLAEVITYMTSVNTSRNGAEGNFTSVRLRGLPNSSQVLLVIDDQPYGGVSADQLVDFARIPVSNIERIEIIRGGSSVLYGANTTGGVIHVITKKPKNEGAQVRFGYEWRSFDTSVERYEAGAKSSFIDGFVTFSRLLTDGFQKNSDVTDENTTMSLGASFPNGGRIGVQMAYNDHEAGVSQGTSVPIKLWNGEIEREPANISKRAHSNRFEGRLTSDLPIGYLGRWKTVLFGSNENYLSNRSVSSFDPDFEKETHILGADSRFMGERGTTLGFAYERDEQTSSIVTERHITNWAGYLQQEMGEEVQIIPAVRFDQHSVYGNQINPRLTAVLRQNDSLTLSGNVSRSYRAPSFTELFYQSPTFAPNPDLDPETAWTYDMGFSWEFLPLQHLKVTRYFTDIRDRITFVDNPGMTPDTYVNAQRAEVDGIEIEMDNKLGWFSQNVNYSYRRSRGISNMGAFIHSFPLTPRHIVNIRSTINFPAHTSLTNAIQYVSHQFSGQNKSGIELPAYAVWNMRLVQRVGSVELFVGVDNILERRYAESFDFDPISFNSTLMPMPDRAYRVGMNVLFGTDI